MCENSLLSFTDELLERNTIYCVLCKEILRPPIFLIEHTGNVCQVCLTEKKINDTISPYAVNNHALDAIIKMLPLPCKFKNKGCTVRLDCEELASHQNSCKYRTKLCSLKHSGCNWEGDLTNFINHFKEKHANHVINLENNHFSLRTSINYLEVVKLLVIMNDTYFLHMQMESNEKKLFYLIRKVSEGNDEFFEYSVNHKGSSNSYIKTKSKILPACNIYDEEIDKSVAVEVDLQSLKQVAQVLDTITSTFKIKVDIRPECLDPIMLHVFECIVCKNYMKPPIYQCQSGHSFCNSCTSRMEKCPTCRSAFGMTRNYSLEGLSEGIQYPCDYHNLGCPEVSAVRNILKHESECPFRPYTCPFPKCTCSGNQKNLIKHLKVMHLKNIVFSGRRGYTGIFRIYSNIYWPGFYFVRQCVMAYDTIFWLTCMHFDKEYIWTVRVICPASLSTTFVCEVTVENIHLPSSKIVKSNYLSNKNLQEEVIQTRITFSYDILQSYSNDYTVKFIVKIKTSEN